VSAVEVSTVTVLGNTMTTTAAINIGVMSGIGVIGVAAVGIWVYQKQQDTKVFEHNQKMLKKEFDFMLSEVEKLQERLTGQFNFTIDYVSKLKKEAQLGLEAYTMELIKDPAHNLRYAKIVEDFSLQAKETIYRLKALESQTFEEMENKIERITHAFNQTPKDATLELQAHKIDAIRQKLQGEFASWQEKFSLVSEYQVAWDDYTKEQKALAMQKGIEGLVEGMEEQSIVIVSPIDRLRASIDEFKEKIKKYDLAYSRFGDIASLSEERLKMVLESIKLDYGKAKEVAIWSEMYREDLAKLAVLELGSEVGSKISTLQNQERITQEEFRSIADEVNAIILAKQERAIALNKLKESLDAMGYSVVNENESLQKLENGEMVYLDTHEEDYKIMLKFNPQTMDITTRIVRVVATQEERENISSYQKEKDLQAAHRWCSRHDKLTHLLKINGIELNTKLRIEPQYNDLTYIVDASIASQKSQSNQTIPSTRGLSID